ncbi:metal ABC transporter permease, partial [Providencia huaxiensis]
LPVKLIHYGLLSLLALTIVASLQAVGIILVIAMLISPGIIAFVLCRSFGKMLVVAIIASVTSSVIGTILSFHINATTGPTIVVTQAVYFVIALLYSKLVLARKRNQTNPQSMHTA